VELISRGARPMTRYFPELLEAFRSLPADPIVLDGEIVVVTPDGLDFDALQQRIHPADSRVKMLSQKTPVSFIAFDLLAVGPEDLRARPLLERRSRLEEELRDSVEPIHITPHTRDIDLARDWFDRFEGAGLDGLIAKRLDQPYQPGKRGWIKYKHSRTADCVVIGFRWSSDRSTLGALLLGLYDDEGHIHYVGHTSSFSVGEKRELLKRLLPMKEEKSFEHMGRAPGGLSRWSHGKDTDWEPIRPELVCEVSYDKLQAGERFRHATGFIRWRPDKPPQACKFDQIVSAARFDVGAIFAGSR
jgi:ATP-dependent DNA ligase